jgi:hypothetical protein
LRLPRANIRLLIALACAAGAPSTAHAATVTATVTAAANKPLVLTKVQDLLLGDILLSSGNWGGAKIGITWLGNFTCNPRATCSGLTQVATYNVSGSNGATVQVTAPNVTLINQSDSSKSLTLVIDRPPPPRIPNSGSKGVDFSIGGSITVDSTTAAGLYFGTLNVTVDYM